MRPDQIAILMIVAAACLVVLAAIVATVCAWRGVRSARKAIELAGRRIQP